MTEHLVVASKIKQTIKKRAGMNCASNVLDELTKIVSSEIDKAIEKAKSNNRKTVMDRDFSQS